MKQIESLRISIRLNLLLAQNSIKENNFNLAICRLQDARALLEQIDVLFQQHEQKPPNIP